jgi:hypothetical protein
MRQYRFAASPDPHDHLDQVRLKHFFRRLPALSFDNTFMKKSGNLLPLIQENLLDEMFFHAPRLPLT